VVISNPKIIYETGDWKGEFWSDVQAMEIDELCVRKAAIESYGKTK
jgi:hypothetical protein